MSPLLWRSSLRYLIQHPWQVGLSILGVALGVAVVVSIDLANQSAKRAFNLSTEVVSGRTTHSILGGPSGVPEELYRIIRVDLGFRQAAPVVEGFVAAPDYPGKALKILGVDPFAEAPFRPYLQGRPNADIRKFVAQPNAVLMSVDTAEMLALEPGGEVRVNAGGVEQTLVLVGLIEPEDSVSRQAMVDLLIADIATAQEVLNRPGRLSKIDLIVPTGTEGGILIARITSVLPAGVELTIAGARSDSVEQLTRAFELNLTALSLLALLVGTFLIYNTMTFSVVRRRGLIGSLRAIGVTRGEIFGLMLGEAFVIGIISSALGIALGIILGRGLVQIVTRTINDLYFVVSVRELALDPAVLIRGAGLGLAATLIAAAIPALEASTVSPRTATIRSTLESTLRRSVPRATIAGVLILLIAALLLLYPSRSILVSFGGMLALVLGSAMLVPASTLALMKLFAPVVSRPFGLMGAIAVRGVSASLSRTAVAVTALTVAISITVGIGIMVGSFRSTVDRWLETSLRADVYVSSSNLMSGRLHSSLLPSVLEAVSQVDGVESISTYRSVRLESSGGTTQIVALGITASIFNSFEFKEGSPSSIWADFQSGDAVIVSEPYAYHHQVGPGSTLKLLTDQGEREFRVGGIYYDYSSGQGVVMVSRDAYQRLWNDTGISSLGIYAATGVEINALEDALRQATGQDQELQIRSNRALKAASLEVFDRSFAITSVMRVLAIIVAFVGVLSALMALQMDRAREIGVLRAIGFTPRQVWVIVTSQTAMLGLVAGLLAIPAGLAQAAGLIFVVNKRSFGWSMDMEIIPSVLVEAVVVAVVAAVLAGVYPALRMASSPAANALREE